MFFAGDLELARVIVLDPTLDTLGPSVQFLEEGSESFPIQQDNNGCMQKSIV